MRQLKILKQITDRQTDSINKYFQDISKYDLISAEEEVELTKRIKKGDLIALEILIKANLRFVVSVSKQYQNKGLSLSDLINEGNLGLIKAAKRFDETRGFKFISYAVWWIRQSIVQAIAEHSRIVRLPLNRVGNINRINKAISELQQKNHREPTVEEIAEHSEITESKVKLSNQIKGQHISFDAPLLNDDGNSTLYDIVNINEMPNPDSNLLVESLRDEINIILKDIPSKEAEIINRFYGLNGKKPESLEDIGNRLGLTRERVRQIKEKALNKLRKSSTKDVLRTYLV